MEKRYELTVGGRLGPALEDAKEVRCLNRIIRWTPNGIEYEADPRLVERFVEQVGLEGANGAATPGAKVASHEIVNEVDMPQSEWTKFRGAAALANFLSADRPDITYSAKEVCRFMSRPTNLAQVALKKLRDFCAQGHAWCSSSSASRPRGLRFTRTLTGPGALALVNRLQVGVRWLDRTSSKHGAPPRRRLR